MLLETVRREPSLSSTAVAVKEVMSVETQFRLNHDNETYPPLQNSSVYRLPENDFEPATSTPKKYLESNFETIKPLNYTPEAHREASHPPKYSPHVERETIKPLDFTSEAQRETTKPLNYSPENHPDSERATDLSTPPPSDNKTPEIQGSDETEQSVAARRFDPTKQHSPSFSDCYTSDSSSAATPMKWEPTSPQTPVTPGSGNLYNQLYPFSFQSPDKERLDREAAFIPRKDQNGIELYFCHLCSFTGTTRDIFAAHMSTHFEHSCPHCDYTSRTEGRLKRHIKDFHSSTPPDSYSGNKTPKVMPGRPKVYRCKQCEFVATEKLDFWAHARTHIKEDKLLQCPKCPFVTEYKHHLEYHLRNHFGSKPFKCAKCNYACVNKSMLNSHMKSHTNVYQYRCADCTYATKYCHSLKLHLRKYNHKPATVLNSDGSLPQGLDAEAAGLSLMMKRGPPRGPRGPRKDKLEAYLGQLMTLPPMGPRPGMNGMMSPYWPLLGQFPNGFHAPPPLLPMSAQGNGMLGCLPQQRIPSFPGQQMITMKCTFCSFSTKSNDELTDHMLKVHASENQDLFNAFGISSESLLEEQCHRRERHSMEESSRDGPADYSRKSSISGENRPPSEPHSQSVGMTESLHIKTDTDDVSKSSPRSWPPLSSEVCEKEGMNSCKSLPDLSYLNSSKTSDTREDSSDILRQMTLKFGSSEAEVKRENKECPLDLTKPKYMTTANYLASVKRSYSEMESSEMAEENQSQMERSEMASPSPRKRSRKGKAYKLDTISWKLQGMSSEEGEMGHHDAHSTGSHEEFDDNSDQYSDKEADFRDVTLRNRGDLNISEDKDDSKEERRFSESLVNTPERERKSFSHGSFEQYQMFHESEGDRKDGSHGDDGSTSPVTDLRRCSMGSNMGMPDHCRKRANRSPSELKDELVLKSAYSMKHVSANPAVRKGAEIAWKILHPEDAFQQPAQDSNSISSQNPDKTEMHRFYPQNLYPSGNHQLSSQKPTAKVNGLNGPLYSQPNGKKVVRGEDKYECDYCEIAFGDCVMYTMHMGYHGYKDPYKCNMCGHQARDKVDFFLHIARVAHA